MKQPYDDLVVNRALRKMMKKLLKVFVPLISLGLMLAVSLSLAQEETSEAPYLYYYSDEADAFVVARADMSDIHLVGEGMLPNTIRYVDGRGWSASGEWLGWLGIDQGGNSWDSIDYSYPRAVNLEGQQVTSIEMYDKGDFLWSPTEDLLISVGRLTGTYVEDAPTASYRAALIDPEIDSILAEVDFEVDVYNSYEVYPEVYWTADGAYAIVSYGREEANETNTAYREHHFFYIFSRDGQQWERDFIGTKISAVSSTGLVIYADNPREISVQNLLTEEVFSIRLPMFIDLGYYFKDFREYFFWNPQGAEALFVPNLPDSSDTIVAAGAWVFEIEERSFTKIQDETLLRSTRTRLSYWSAEGNYLLLLNESGLPMLFDLRTDTSIQIASDSIRGWQWDDESGINLFYVDTPIDYDWDSIFYELESGESIRSQGIPAAIASPNRQYFAAIEENPIIIEQASQSSVHLQPSASKFVLSNGGEVLWHPDSEWLILLEDEDFENVPSSISVTNIDGTIHHDLTRCISGCVGWLPPQVDVQQLPPAVAEVPGQLQPVQTIETDHTVSLLSWSPDGRFLASGTGFGNQGTWEWDLMWDTETGRASAINDTMTSSIPCCRSPVISWSLNEAGTYDPLPSSIAGDALSPDGRHAIEGIEDYMYLTVIDSHDRIFYFDGSFNRGYGIVSFSPDGILLVGGGSGEQITFWSARNGTILKRLPIYGNVAVFSPDASKLAVGSSWNILIYEMDEIWGGGD
jgi:WD40 repeat protein